MAPTGPVPAPLCRHIEVLDRGERETRGERRGSGERLPSGSRFVFSVCLLVAAVLSPLPLAGQDGFSLGVRLAGVASTRLVGDGIGFSAVPDSSLLPDFRRDSVMVRASLAPDVTLFAGLPFDDTIELQIAFGYSFTQLTVERGSEAQEVGSARVGHAVFSVARPIRGVQVRFGAGALWFEGARIAALREGRALNPMVELAGGGRWQAAGFDLNAALVGQVTQYSSEALEARRGSPGIIYRLGLELGFGRSFGR